MVWEGHWWGIILVSEGEADDRLLKSIYSGVPDQADFKYEEGEMCLHEPNTYQNTSGFERSDTYDRYVLEFMR